MNVSTDLSLTTKRDAYSLAATRTENSAVRATKGFFDGRTLLQVQRNSLVILHQETPQAGIAAFNVTFHCGVNEEPPSKQGLRHAFEHLQGRVFQERLKKLEPLLRIGSDYGIRATTTIDGIHFSWWGPSDKIEAAFRIFTESLSPDFEFPPSTLTREKSRIRVESLERASTPEIQLLRDLAIQSFPGSYLGTCPSGRLDRPVDTSASALKQFLHEKLLSARMVVSFAGGPSTLIDSAVVHIPSRPAMSEELGLFDALPRDASGPQMVFRKRESDLLYLAVGVPWVAVDHTRIADLSVLAHVLRSQIDRELDQDGLIYSAAELLFHEDRERGVLGVSLKTAPEYFTAVCAKISEQLDRLRRIPQPELTLQVAKDLRDRANLASSTASAASAWALDHAVGRTPFKDFSSLMKYLESINAERISALASEVLTGDRLTFVVYANEKPTFGMNFS